MVFAERALLVTIHSCWATWPPEHHPLLQKALWLGTLAGANNSGVPIYAVSYINELLMKVGRLEVTTAEASEQLDRLLPENRKGERT